MPRYVFRMPISGTIEVTAEGEDSGEAVINYLSGVGAPEVETAINYQTDPENLETIGCFNDDGELEEF